ncbi:hypothetical protein [Bifidobacterium aesculapii]|uniref:hypothetical protein n=1 Tax=Bifidobacterium aesculapii TaxID=1329411 RepID=UPI0006E2ADBF|nr:hypothetical protein [Bifidobacterium aesculapii]
MEAEEGGCQRPYVLYRNPTLYDKTSVKVTTANDKDNPFVPSSGEDGDDGDVSFKPAPSDANAYYFVESTDGFDWSSLPDAQVDTGSEQ